MSSLLRFSVCAAACLIHAACFYYIEHNPPLAAETARRFAQVAFVNKDFSSGLRFVLPNRRNDFTEQSLSKLVETMHPDGDFPNAIIVTGYEVLPGTRSVDVYLESDDALKTRFYRIRVEGDRYTGYFVSELFRQDTRF